jgi:hypothetical protein
MGLLARVRTLTGKKWTIQGVADQSLYEILINFLNNSYT